MSIGLIILILFCFVAAHHLRIAGQVGYALLALGLGLYFLIPSWPAAAYAAIGEVWHGAPAGATNLIGAVVLLAVSVIGCKLVFSTKFWK